MGKYFLMDPFPCIKDFFGGVLTLWTFLILVLVRPESLMQCYRLLWVDSVIALYYRRVCVCVWSRLHVSVEGLHGLVWRPSPLGSGE